MVRVLLPICPNAVCALSQAGDVNLFFVDEDDAHAAEIEVMVAEKASRRKGIGHEAVLLMLRYGIERLAVRKFTAKILQHNAASVRMFTERLGFVEVGRSEVFKELHFELVVDERVRRRIEAATAGWAVRGG